MAEYIDKAALVSEVEKNKLMAREPAARRILEIIKGMTVFVGVGLNADVAPVRHGRWISWEDADNCIPSPHRHECSVCHDAAQVLVNNIELLSNYCPNCGARMDG